MNRFYALIFLLFLCMGAFSQEITVRFTGQLNGTSYCRLDSVAVTNLTRNWMETVEYPDTIIVLGGTVGTNLNVAATQGLGQNIPNPFDCETRVELSVSQRENVRMQLLDASGKQYAEYSGSLDAGEHTFDISAAAPQTYILNAVVGDKTYSIRMVNMGSGCGSSIKYAGISGSITAKLNSTNEFQNGDNMRYVGYTTIEGEVVASTAVEQAQTISEVITLNFTHCINTFGTDIQSACDSYTWIDGETYTESTTEPTFTLTNAAGCDSIVTLNLTINRNAGIDTQTACETYTWIDGVTYTESTIEPTFTLTNAAGCDSVVTLHLTINHSNSGVDEQTACDSYTWIDDVTYTESTNEPTFTLTNAAGCDSVVTLHLTINHSNTGIDEQTACDSYTWIDDVTYTESTNEPTFTLTNAAGCDSVVTLHLTITHGTTGIDEQTACESYTWMDGITYTESTNEPTFTLTNAVGCDSVVTLHLTINHRTTGIDEQTACESYTWIDDVTYTESTNEPTFTLTNALGCDSVVTLHLTINHSTTGIDEQTACESYTWMDGITYTESTNEPTFTLTNAAGCDSVVTLHFTIICPPSVQTNAATDIIADGATLSGNVTSDGGADVTARGFMYGTDANSLTRTIQSGSGTGSFTANLTGLTYGTTYYYKAYATNSVGTAYGEVLSFTTNSAANAPTVQTNAATSITATSATLSGSIISNGGATITDRGFIYGTDASSLLQTVQSGSGNGNFTKSITGLASGTTYYYKAYATNREGTSYGDVMSFTTEVATTGTLDGHDWVDLGLPSGTRWATCNVGADYEYEAGNLYAWGETNVRYNYQWSNYYYCNGSYNTITKYCCSSDYGYNGFSDSLTTLEASDDVATATWGAGWRMPTKAEMDELYDYCYHVWTTRYTRPGMQFIGPNRNSIFLRAAGRRRGNEVDYFDSDGYYWSSTLYSNDFVCSAAVAYRLHFDSERCDFVDDDERRLGMAVRPVCVSAPYVNTDTATDITLTGAILSGNVTFDGGSTVTARGFVYGTSASNLTQNVQSENGTGSFTKALTGLSHSTTYYYKAYATNSIGTSYGEVKQFTTSSPTMPTVQTNDASGLTITSATLSGNVTSDGGAEVTVRGFIYGTRANNLTHNVQSGSGTGSFTEVLTDLAISTTYYYKAYATNSVGTAYGEVMSFTTLSTTGTLNGHDWVDLGLPSGTRWAACNVGANSPEEYGDFFAWGETSTKTTYSSSNYSYSSNPTTLPARKDAATANWGSGWRMPTQTEMNELLNNCTHVWTTQNGVRGRLFTGPNGNSIFLPAAGYYLDGNHYTIQMAGQYWSSSLSSSDTSKARDLFFSSDNYRMSTANRYYGQSVRAVCMP